MAQEVHEVLLCHRQGNPLLFGLSLQLHPTILVALEFQEDPDHQLVQAGIPLFHLRSLEVQEVQGTQEGPGVHLFHLVLAKVTLVVLCHLFLLFHQGSLEHLAAQVWGGLGGLAGLAVLGNLWGRALLSTPEPRGSPARLSLPRVLCQSQFQVGLEDLLHLCLP